MPIKLPPYIHGPVIIGVDLYHASKIIDLHAAKAAGVDFAWVKAGESDDIFDPLHDETCARCDDAAIIVGSYWFTHADKPAAPQANLLVNRGRGKKGDLIRAMDTETLNKQSGAIAGQHSVEFETAIRAATGRGAVAYSDQSFFEDNILPYVGADVSRWLARYGAAPAIPCQFFQFADGANVVVDVPGLEGPTDVNVFFGTLAQLIAGFTYQ
jgi:lysozyme